MPEKPKEKNVTDKKTDSQKNEPKKSSPQNQQTEESRITPDKVIDKETKESTAGGSVSDFFKNLDFKLIIDTLSDLVTNYKKTIDIIKNSLIGANEFFKGVKQENYNVSLGFFTLVLAITAIFGFINGLIYGAPIQAVGSVFMMIIMMPIFFLVFTAVAAFVLKLFGSKGTFADTCKVACYASWIGLISSFPLFTLLGSSVILSLITLITLALSTFIWIKGAITVLEMDKDRAIMLIGGLFVILCLITILT